MTDLDNEFFQGKRPWSKIKDKVLGGYMPAYLRKVTKLERPILLIDGYAGPGVFDDGFPGSPLIMCKAAEQHSKNQYRALFVNHNEEHHEKLTAILKKQGWYPRANPILGDSAAFLEEVSAQLSNQTVFLYLDPFGLKGCEFGTLEPFLTRSNSFSTEIVVNISMPITHRLAAAKKVAEGLDNDPRIVSFHARMTAVFGGDYWKDIYFSDLDAEEKEFALLEKYQSLISQFLPFTGSCPVRETSSSRIKYFIMFTSRHPDAMLLMNDEMCKAYFGQMHKADFAGTLFEKLDWKDMRTRAELDKIILSEVALNPGFTRHDLWLKIVQRHFMQFTSPEFKESVKNLVKSQKISIEYTSTRRLNDRCRLFPP